MKDATGTAPLTNPLRVRRQPGTTTSEVGLLSKAVPGILCADEVGDGGRLRGSNTKGVVVPVWVSTDETLDLNKSGERRRHINSDCPIYLAEVPTKDRSPAKGRPNTVKLQEVTARCEHDKCWGQWEKDQQDRKAKGKSGTSSTSAKGAATVPAKQVGGKAAALAAKAAAARQKPAAATA